MNEILLVAVPVLYGGIQTIELSAVLARIAGLQMGRNMTGYALQQSMYMGTRLLLVLLLPLLGLAVDSGMSGSLFATMAHLSLLSSAFFGAIVIFLRNPIINYYCGVLRRYDSTGKYLRSFFSPDMLHGESHKISLALPKNAAILWYSLAIFTIYSTGMFISFFGAVIFPDYRTSISQSSGIINALGAVLLTFFVEPTISRNIDLATEDASCMVFALLIGRWLAVAIVGQIVLLAFFGAFL